MHKTGKGYITGKICHGRKCMPVHVTCRGKVTLTKQGKRTWYAIKRASRCKAKARAKTKAHRVKTHRKPPKKKRHFWSKWF
jgi:hypothetical protein